jgi:hypothetical protein
MKTKTNSSPSAKPTRADLRAALTSASDYTLRSLSRVHTLSALAPLLLTHPLVLRTYRTLSSALPAGQGPWVDISQTADSVRFGATLYELDSFKDECLLQALEPFADAADTWVADSTDWTYSARPNRDYSFVQRVELDPYLSPMPAPLRRALLRAGDLAPQAFDLRVVVCAYVKTDSPLCRVVVKGIEEKIVREEIKEIVCA